MTMLDALRERLIKIIGLALITLLLNPTPVNQTALNHVLAAQMAGTGGHPAAVFEHLELVSPLLPSVKNLPLLTAEAAFAMGDPQKAIQTLNRQRADDLDVPEPHCLYAKAYLQLERQEEALEHWELAKEPCPQFELSLRSHIDELIEEQRYAEAEIAIRVHGSINPSDAQNHYRLGMIIASRDPEMALAPLRLAFDLDSGGHSQARQLIQAIEDARAHQDPAYSLAVVGQHMVTMQEWTLAREAFQAAIAIQPDYIDARAYYGLCLDRSGGNGLEVLQEAVESGPDRPLPRLYLGIHWLQKHEFKLALEQFEYAAQLDPENAGIYAQIGQTYDIMGDIANAIEAYRIAAELAPQDPIFWLMLAQLSLNHEFRVETVGLPAARNALALNAADPKAMDALGFGYLLIGDLDYAERFLVRSLWLDPMQALTQYHFALLKATQNDLPAAAAALRFAQHLEPDGAIGDLAGRALQTIAP